MQKGSRAGISTKLKNPCKECRYRAVSCHSTCFLFKEWKNQTEIIAAIGKKEKDLNMDFYGVRKARVRKRER